MDTDMKMAISFLLFTFLAVSAEVTNTLTCMYLFYGSHLFLFCN